MTEADLPVEAGGEDIHVPARLVRITGWVAVFGGFLALAVALLVSISVLGRWLFNAPIDGDFEFVKMATAVAVFAYLPYTQAKRGNIMVDTFTGGLSVRNRNRLDAFWDLVFGVVTAFLAVALTVGTYGSFLSGETTMQRQSPLWPSIGLAAILCAIVAITCPFAARALLRAGGNGGVR